MKQLVANSSKRYTVLVGKDVLPPEPMNQKGFSQIILLGIVAVLVLVGTGGFLLLPKKEISSPDKIIQPPTPLKQNSLTTPNSQPAENTQPTSLNAGTAKVADQDLDKKIFCPDPFIFDLPIDINKATSVLYPGQIRGNDFKAHGGFRFDNSRPEEIMVVAPIDAPIVTGARYPVNGEIQYTLEFEHPCGIRYRLGHLLTLTPKFQAIAEKFPLPETLDSRTTEVRPPIAVKKGEIIAIAVGLTGEGIGSTGEVNTFLDWGVYDYRQKNEASQDPAWAVLHTSLTYQYGVCWFDWISDENRAKVLSLPSSDGISGKQSDFCK